METKYFNIVLHIKKLLVKNISIICVHCYSIASEITQISKIANKKNF